MITPQEYTRNIMHQIPDIENNASAIAPGVIPVSSRAGSYVDWSNILEVMKKKLKVYDERLVKLEDKIFDKGNCIYCLSDWCKFAEVVCLWTLVIMLSIKVFN
jgi:hypothetical protein